MLDAAWAQMADRLAEAGDTASVRVVLDAGGRMRLAVERLDALEIPESLVELRALTAAMLPRIDLPELLQEVHAWTGFLHAYVHVSGQDTIWKLDRLGRSVKEVRTFADQLPRARDRTSNPDRHARRQLHTHRRGQVLLTIMAAFAELERDMIYQRTMAGLAAARAQGRVGGRPSVINPDKLAAITARLARGESPTHIAKALGVSRATIYRHTDVVTARSQG